LNLPVSYFWIAFLPVLIASLAPSVYLLWFGVSVRGMGPVRCCSSKKEIKKLKQEGRLSPNRAELIAIIAGSPGKSGTAHWCVHCIIDANLYHSTKNSFAIEIKWVTCTTFVT
jgi:hypothetical protein